MTDDELAAIEQRVQVATPGPWEADESYRRLYIAGPAHDEDAVIMEGDADFIAHAREDVPALLAEVRRLRDFAGELADEPCSYGDNCPTFGTRHGTCLHCKARKAMETPVAR